MNGIIFCCSAELVVTVEGRLAAQEKFDGDVLS